MSIGNPWIHDAALAASASVVQFHESGLRGAGTWIGVLAAVGVVGALVALLAMAESTMTLARRAAGALPTASTQAR